MVIPVSKFIKENLFSWWLSNLDPSATWLPGTTVCDDIPSPTPTPTIATTPFVLNSLESSPFPIKH